MTEETDVIAVYFPSWHPDDHYREWYGEGFSEWKLVEKAKPLFAGHHQPKEPTWGFFDESDAYWMEKQIDLAADHGVTSFMFDWYWYKGNKFLHKALEDGYLNSSNRDRVKFFIMWANHTWSQWPAVTGKPGMRGKENQGALPLLHVSHSLADLERMIEYCCKTYFVEPSYKKINGKPCYAMYNLPTLIKGLGGEEEVRQGLMAMDQIIRKHGFPGAHWIANIGACEDNEYCCGWDRTAIAKRMGFNSVFAYNIVRTPGSMTVPEEMPLVDYKDVMDSHEYCWERMAEGGMNHWPSVTLGCDITPRWHEKVQLPMPYVKWHYEPIIINNTPERFGYLVKKALDKAQDGDGPHAIIINAWNEWTEGMFLLPEKQYGSAYLEQIAKLRDKTKVEK